MLAAPSRGGIIAGYAIAALLRWLVTAAVVTVAALIGGMDVPGEGVDLFGLLVLGMLANVTRDPLGLRRGDAAAHRSRPGR